MKVNVNKNDQFSITGLNIIQFEVLFAVLSTADRRCFNKQDEDGNYYSNEDFVLKLSDEQRSCLSEVVTNLDNYFEPCEQKL